MMHEATLFSNEQLTLIGWLLLAVSFSTFLWYLYVVLAVCRLMLRYPSFILIGSHAISDLVTMVQYVWLSLDMVVQNKIPISYPMATMLYNFGWYPGLFHFMVVAFNRAHIVLDPTKHDKFWTQRVTVTFAVISWLLGLIFAVVFSYALPARVQSYYIYVPVNFAQRLDDSFDTKLLLIVELSTNAVTLIPSLVAYAFSFAYSIQLSCRQHFGKTGEQITLFSRRIKIPSQKGGAFSWSVQQRLWVICIFNLLPSAVHVFFLTYQPHKTSESYVALLRAFFGLFATMIPSVLLPVFSTLVRRNLPFCARKVATTTVAPLTTTV